MPQNRDVDGIKVNRFFSGIRETVIAAIFNPKDFVEVSEGDLIYQTGEESTQVYILLKGEIKIKYSDSTYVSSKIMNDFFGEKEMLEGTRRISSAVAHRSSLIYKLDKTIVMGLMAKYPAVKSNINKYGESKLPESTFGASRIVDIAKNSKPVSFQAFRKSTTVIVEKEPEEEYSIPFTPEIPVTEPPEVQKTEIKVQEKEENLKKQLSDIPEDFKNWKFTEVTPKKIAVEQKKPEKTEVELPEIEETEPEVIHPEQKIEKVFDRENIKRLFACIQAMNGGINLVQTIQSISSAIKELTFSESVELCLIDEKKAEIHKFVFEAENYSQHEYKLPEGLTGTCALQKKIINFERPTEDSRFNQKIDQPGNSGLKRILYFPVISDAGDTIAVIQLARENNKYDDDEIANLNMLSKLIESYLRKSIELEELLNTQQLSTEGIIENLILNDISPPIKIINSYIELLSEKKLPPEIDEILRMLQKQVYSVGDIITTIFSSSDKDLKLDTKEVQFNEMIDDILELLSEYCDSREVKLYKKIGNGAVVRVDRAKFYTAIFQIIKFACNHSKKDGRIYFSTDKVGDTIQLHIKDEGKGIDEELQSRFSRQSHDLTGETLDSYGLIIAKKIIESHSGQISLDSKKNEGTTFLIVLGISMT